MTIDSAGPTRAERMLRSALFLVWMVVTAFVVARHEPWRDEADTWLLARDASLSTILSQADSYGSPALWQVLLMAPAKAGLPIAAQQWINWTFCAFVVWLIVFRFELPWPARLTGVVTFQFAYEYAVVSRSYAMGIALVAGSVALWRRRSEHALAIGALLALAANTSVHALILAAAAAVAIAVDSTIEPRRRLATCLLFGGGLLAAVAQLYPPGSFVEIAPRGAIHRAMAGAVAPLGPTPIGGFAGCLAAAAILLSVWRCRTTLSFLLFALVGYGVLFQVVYLGFPRHHGFLLVSMIFAMALFAAERSAKEVRLAGIVLALAFVPSVVDAFNYGRLDIARPYSGGVAAARAIETHVPAAMPVAAHKPGAAESVLVHLARRSFYYPQLARDGSFMRWDQEYWSSTRISSSEAIALAERHYAGRGYAMLLDTPLPPEYAALFDVVAVEGRDVFSDTAEIYAVCLRR
jgi:hypothetical protein